MGCGQRGEERLWPQCMVTMFGPSATARLQDGCGRDGWAAGIPCSGECASPVSMIGQRARPRAIFRSTTAGRTATVVGIASVGGTRVWGGVLRSELRLESRSHLSCGDVSCLWCLACGCRAKGICVWLSLGSPDGSDDVSNQLAITESLVFVWIALTARTGIRRQRSFVRLSIAGDRLTRDGESPVQ